MIELTPEYERRRDVIQPQFIRPRAAYRSPMKSEQFNLHAAQFNYDLLMLRAQLNGLRLEFEAAMEELTNGGVTFRQVGVTAISEAIEVLFAKIQQYENRIKRLEAKRGLQ